MSDMTEIDVPDWVVKAAVNAGLASYHGVKTFSSEVRLRSALEATARAMLAAAQAASGGEDFSCCGGNDETPKLHCMDCPRTAPEPLAQGGVDTSTNEAWAARAQEKIAAMDAASVSEQARAILKSEMGGFGTDTQGRIPLEYALRAIERALTTPSDAGGEAVPEPFAWFAWGDHNGPVPLELFGWDKKACKHAVLTYARSQGWKGTITGFLGHNGWTLRPAYTTPKPSADAVRELQNEVARLNAIVNTPQSNDFLRAVSTEAEHQRQRWGSSHDAGKTPADWFWLVGYLAGKALHAHAAGDAAKAEHHIITTAAALANWHLAAFGKTDMRPGIDGESLISGGSHA